jgi:hypothetical protein
MTPELQLLGEQVAAIVARNTATEVVDRIRSRKAAHRAEETIAELEGLVNGLIADKSELIGVAHAYEEQLAAQRLSEADVKYLTENLFPIVTKLAEESAASNQSDPTQARAMIDVIRPLVSTEALTILQVIGFNFKRAIGEPLTDLVRSLIVARAAPSVATQQDLQSLTLKRETLIYEVALNQEAHVRLMRLLGQPPSAETGSG